MLNTKTLQEMNKAGRTEEVLSILLSDFYVFVDKYPGSDVFHLALLTGYRWKMSNPGEDNINRVEEILEEYLKCPS